MAQLCFWQWEVLVWKGREWFTPDYYVLWLRRIVLPLLWQKIVIFTSFFKQHCAFDNLFCQVSLFKQYSCFLWVTTLYIYSCCFSSMFYASNKDCNLAHAERLVVFFGVAVLSPNWFQVGQENIIPYKRHSLLCYVAYEHCSEKSCLFAAATQQQGPTFKVMEKGFVAGGGEGNMRDKMHLGDSRIKHKVRFAHPLPREPPFLPTALVCGAAPCRGVHSSTANTHALHFSPSFLCPQCSRGNSCRMLPVIRLILSHL